MANGHCVHRDTLNWNVKHSNPSSCSPCPGCPCECGRSALRQSSTAMRSPCARLRGGHRAQRRTTADKCYGGTKRSTESAIGLVAEHCNRVKRGRDEHGVWVSFWPGEPELLHSKQCLLMQRNDEDRVVPARCSIVASISLVVSECIPPTINGRRHVDPIPPGTPAIKTPGSAIVASRTAVCSFGSIGTPAKRPISLCSRRGDQF
jgi:hypothetical protein